MADDPFVAATLGVFLEETSSILARLRVASREGDRAGLSRLAHALAGTGGTFGFPALRASAEALESALAEPANGNVPGRAGDLMRVCEQIIGSRHLT
jgi:HPt (histidine-containing phosphotransfer) domain-containing protein